MDSSPAPPSNENFWSSQFYITRFSFLAYQWRKSWNEHFHPQTLKILIITIDSKLNFFFQDRLCVIVFDLVLFLKALRFGCCATCSREAKKKWRHQRSLLHHLSVAQMCKKCRLPLWNSCIALFLSLPCSALFQRFRGIVELFN